MPQSGQKLTFDARDTKGCFRALNGISARLVRATDILLCKSRTFEPLHWRNGPEGGDGLCPLLW